MFMLQSLEYYSSMFERTMLSGDDYIAHYLILIKSENSNIVMRENVSGFTLLNLHRCIPFLKLSELCLGCSLMLTSLTLSYSSPDTRLLGPALPKM